MRSSAPLRPARGAELPAAGAAAVEGGLVVGVADVAFGGVDGYGVEGGVGAGAEDGGEGRRGGWRG